MMTAQYSLFYLEGAEKTHLYYHYHEHLGITV